MAVARSQIPEDYTRTQRWRARAKTSLLSQTSLKCTTWTPGESDSTLPDPRGHGEYPACTSSPWEARPATAEGVGKAHSSLEGEKHAYRLENSPASRSVRPARGPRSGRMGGRDLTKRTVGYVWSSNGARFVSVLGFVSLINCLTSGKTSQYEG